MFGVRESGFINRPTYMPKERFNEEKKGIAVRIQQLIAQGESITQMMEVWAMQGLDRRARRTARWDGRRSAD